MFHMFGYQGAVSSVSTNSDLSAAVDAELTQQSNHYVLTNDFKLLALAVVAKNISQATMLMPTINSVTKFNVDPLSSDSIIQSPPRIALYTPYPIELPQNEQLQFQASGSGVAETATMFGWIGDPQWNQNIPRGIGPVPVFTCKVTATITLNPFAWSALGALTFEQSLRGGTYAVVGAQWQGTGLLGVRIVFPRSPNYNNQRMRPGVLATQLLGNQRMAVSPWDAMFWGQHGRFSTFEPPQIECWGITSSSTAIDGRLSLVRISDNANVVY